MADVVNNPDTTQNFDAEILKEAIAEGETKGIKVDLASDYESAQQMSQGTLSESEAEASVAPNLKVSKPQDVAIATNSANDSVDYTELAREVNSTSSSSNPITDDVVEKALKMGQAGQS